MKVDTSSACSEPSNPILHESQLRESMQSRESFMIEAPEMIDSPRGDEDDDLWPVLRCRIFAAISSMNSANIGYDLGVNTGLSVSFTRQTGGVVFMDTMQLEVYMASLTFASIFGGLAMKFISDPYGRRGVFLASQAFLLGGLAINIATNEYALILVGRLIAGFAVGLSFSVDSVYISEIAPKKHRGQLVSWAETGINIGINLGFIMSFAFQNTPGNTQWRVMIGLGMIMPFAMFVLVLFVLPESPRWLLLAGRFDEAASVLDMCSHPHQDGRQLAVDMQRDIDEEVAASKGVTFWSLWTVPANRLKMRAGVGVALCGAFSGIDGIQYYLLAILGGAGMAQREQFQALLVVGLVKLLVVSLGGYIFDKWGRRPGLMMSLCGISAGLFIMAATHNNRAGLPGDDVVIVAFVAVIVYVSSFSMGVGPGAWLLPTEIYSNDIRTNAISFTVVVNRIFATITALTFLSMIQAMGYGGFIMFGLINICSCLFVYLFVPETKGATLEDIHELFEKQSPEKNAAGRRII